MSAAASTADSAPGDEAFAEGRPVLVGDPSDPIVFVAAAAERIGAEELAQVQELGGGMTLLGLSAAHADRLALSPLPPAGGTGRWEGLGVTLASPVDATHGIRGGWSLDDRAHTMRVASDPDSRPGDLAVPGHVHPAAIGGEATPAALGALELALRCGHAPAVVLGAVSDRDGSPVAFAAARGGGALRRLPVVSSGLLSAHALARRSAGRTVECALPTRDGAFRAVALDDGTGEEARATVLALLHGDPAAREHPVVHIHAACLLGDAFGSLMCDCAAEFRAARQDILAAGAGVIVYVKPGTADPARRYHCGREAPLDLAPVLALLISCGVDPMSVR